ncbi:MAG: twin-arginine translocase subunit TatC [Dissulfurimicrobium hydrothermale]|uniref:twin-arginine translocase subunit TatC n=1 Tax=Dissulfurimicrobium hydrothermale TaxID=1750598 RepID=UPI003C752FCF
MPEKISEKIEKTKQITSGSLQAEPSLARDLARFLMFIRCFIIETLVVFFVSTFIIYWFSPHILAVMQRHLATPCLAFFGVMEPVVALLKLSSIVALAFIAPFVAFRVSQGLAAVFGMTRRFSFMVAASSLILFYSGSAFCYLVTLPFGARFLLEYQSEHLRPIISVGRFVDFAGFFMLGFGFIFELPLLMTVLCRLNVCSYKLFVRQRRYAILLISIVAAVLTPTPDVFNMTLMGLPLYFLYELGIIFARMNSRLGSCP